MIKLIATDIDGTLLPEGSDYVNPELYEVVEKLKKYDVIFAAASGRQYYSIKRLFEPVANDMIFICENGSNIICRGYQMYASVIEKDTIRKLISYYQPYKEQGCYMTASTTGPMYTDGQDDAYKDMLENGYHNKMEYVDHFDVDKLDIVKCSFYKAEGIAPIADKIVSDWKDTLNTVVAGEPWVDFMNYGTDKGAALQSVQKILHILPEETMAFGDNHNDLGMMKAAGESYAVANARTAVKEAAKHLTASNKEDGVLQVLKHVLAEYEKEEC